MPLERRSYVALLHFKNGILPVLLQSFCLIAKSQSLFETIESKLTQKTHFNEYIYKILQCRDAVVTAPGILSIRPLFRITSVWTSRNENTTVDLLPPCIFINIYILPGHIIYSLMNKWMRKIVFA